MRTVNWKRTRSRFTRWRTISTRIRSTGLMGKRRSVRDSMFTGIVEETGVVESIRPTAKAIELTVRLNISGHGLKIGDSLAVNGCCLTVVKVAAHGNRRLAQFDLLKETWQRTNLQF